MSHRNRVTLISAVASSLTLGLLLLLTGWMLWRSTQDGINRRLEGSYRGIERRVFGEPGGPPPGGRQPGRDRPAGSNTTAEPKGESPAGPPDTAKGPSTGAPNTAGGDHRRQGQFGRPGDQGRPHSKDWRHDLIEGVARMEPFRRHDAPVSSSIYELDGRQVADVNNGSLTLPTNLKDIDFPANVSWKIFTTQNGQAKILVATDTTDQQSQLRQSYLALVILWPALTALLTLATFAAISSSFRPLNRMLAQAHTLGLADRLQTGDKAEFGELAASINAYLDRIETVVRQQEEFAVDAAHELCTPLTAIRGQLEVAMLKKADAKEFSEAAKRAITQVSRLERLVESLLLAARPRGGEVEVIDVQAVVEEAQARWVDRYAEKQVALDVTTEPYFCAMRTEEIESVIDNVLANALRYSPAHTSVAISLESSGLLVVQDEGSGIPAENREKIFERFERGTSVGRGFGIGLYLARRLLANREGSISIGDSEKGTRVEVRLPGSKAA